MRHQGHNIAVIHIPESHVEEPHCAISSCPGSAAGPRRAKRVHSGHGIVGGGGGSPGVQHCGVERGQCTAQGVPGEVDWLLARGIHLSQGLGQLLVHAIGCFEQTSLHQHFALASRQLV